MGYVGRVQLLQLGLEFGEVLPVYQRFHQVMLGHVLLVDQVFDQLVAVQQALHQMQAILQAFLRFLFADVHGVLLPVERGQRLKTPAG